MPESDATSTAGEVSTQGEGNFSADRSAREESVTVMVNTGSSGSLGSSPLVSRSRSASDVASTAGRGEHTPDTPRRRATTGPTEDLLPARTDAAASTNSMAVTEAVSTSQQITADSRDAHEPSPAATKRAKESLFQRIKKPKRSTGSKDGMTYSEASPATTRRSSGWKKKWRVANYNSRNEEFRKLFAEVLEPDEILIDDFSCAVHKEILQQGRLYLSRDHACFHANIFGFETRLAFRWENIQAITREKTAMVFPNALQITVQVPDADESVAKQYFFSSFVRRDLTHSILMKVWQNKLCGAPESAADLRRYVCERYGFNPDVSEDDDDADADESDGGKGSLEDVRDGGGDMSDTASTAESPASSSEEQLSPAQCSCTDHVSPVFIDEEFSIPVDHLYDMFFTDGQPSEFMKSWNQQRKLTDYIQPAWTETDGTDVKSRSITFIMPMEVKLGPKTSQATESQTVIYERKGEAYRVEAEVSNAGIPYADTFYTYVEYCLTRVSKSTCRLRIGACIRYRKSCFSMVKTMIERTAAEGMRAHHEKLSVHIRETCKATSPASQTSAPSPRRPSTVSLAADVTSRPAIRRGMSNMSTATIIVGDSAPTATAGTAGTYSASSSSNSQWYFNIVVTLLLLLHLFLLTNLVLRPYGCPGATSPHVGTIKQTARDHIQEPLGASIGKPEEWRTLLELEHQTHQQEMERMRLALLASSKVLAKVASALENYVDLTHGPTSRKGVNARTCRGESCPERPSGDTLEQTIESLVALQEEIAANTDN